MAILALATPSASWGLSAVTSGDLVDQRAVDILAVWSDVAPGVKSLPTLTIDDSIYPDKSGVQFLIDGTPDDRYPKVRPDGFDATGPQDASTFHVYPSLVPADGSVLKARWTDRNGNAHVSEHVVGTDAAADAPFPAAGLVTWKDVGVGTTGMPTVTIDDSIYPNQRGVQLFVNGKADDRSPKARPDGWDATGPWHSSTFHHYPKLTLENGMALEARSDRRVGHCVAECSHRRREDSERR